MTEVPKFVPGIVCDRLQAAAPQSVFGQAHPDADLLAAFAEQAISAPERDSLLTHLANCGDCRDVVALALPAQEIRGISIAAESDPVGAQASATKTATEVATKTKTRNGWLSSLTFAAPTFRWAAMAAGVAVVASVLLMRPSLHPERPTIARNDSPAPQIAPPQVLAKTETQPSPGTQTSKKFEAPSATNSDPGQLIAENTIAREAKDLDRAVGDRAVGKSNSTSISGAPMTRNDTLSIERAKPASPVNLSNSPALDSMSTAEIAAKSRGRETSDSRRAESAELAPIPNATFGIVGGILQRSLDNGQSWKNALHADHSLLCYASNDRDIWTGGEAGALFHSSDGGVTWIRVQASVGAQTLISEITHIDLRRAPANGQLASVVITTANQETWSSADGGTTWEKK